MGEFGVFLYTGRRQYGNHTLYCSGYCGNYHCTLGGYRGCSVWIHTCTCTLWSGACLSGDTSIPCHPSCGPCHSSSGPCHPSCFHSPSCCPWSSPSWCCSPPVSSPASCCSCSPCSPPCSLP